VVYLFEVRSALQGVVIEVVFSGVSEKKALWAGIRGEPVSERGRALKKAKLSLRARGGIRFTKNHRDSLGPSSSLAKPDILPSIILN